MNSENVSAVGNEFEDAEEFDLGNCSIFGMDHDFEAITLYFSLYDRGLVKQSSSLGNLSRKQRCPK